jgi:hypothetical protein
MNTINKMQLLLIFLGINNGFGQALEWATGTQGKGGVETHEVDFDSEGNVYSVGDFNDTIDLDPSDEEYILECKFDPALGYGLDGYIQKMDKHGNHLWAYRFGSFRSDSFSSIVVDDENNLYVLGYFSDTVDFDLKETVHEIATPGTHAGCVIKYDEDANLLWTYIFEPLHRLYGITHDSEGNVYITGETNTQYIFIAKLSPSGTLVWAHEFGEDSAWGLALDCDAENNIYISGKITDVVDFDPSDEEYIEGEPSQIRTFILKLTSDGNLVWVKSINLSHMDVTNLEISPDGLVCIVGEIHGAGDIDPGIEVFNINVVGLRLFAYTLNLDGEFEWIRYARNTEGGSKAFSLECNEDEIFVTGTFSKELELLASDESPVGISVTGIVGFDGFIYRLKTNGDLISLHGFGGELGDKGNCISLDEDGSLYTCGYFQDTCNIDPYGDGFDLIRDVGYSHSGYIQKIDLTESADIIQTNTTYKIEIYPNPFQKDLFIESFDAQITSARIVSVNGQEVSAFANLQGLSHLNLEELPLGIYFLHLTDHLGIVSTHKIIKI